MSKSAGKRTGRVEYTVTQPITLGDLRWLVAQCEDLSDDATVTTKEYKSRNQFDWDEASITVSGVVAP